MEVPFEGGQGAEVAVAPYMDGWKCYSGQRQPCLVNTTVSILSFAMNVTHFADS